MALKYGLARKINVYNVTTQMGEEVLSTAGDYFQAQLWADKGLSGIPDEMKDVISTFAWAYFALKRNGKLNTYGLPDELTQEALFEMADNITVYIDQIEEGSLPLAEKPPKR